MLCAAPWYFASTPWAAQYWLVLSGIIVTAALTLEVLYRFRNPLIGPKLAVPALALTLFFSAGYAYVQSIPLYDGMPSKSGSIPASIRIQRWFLGSEDVSMDARFGIVTSTKIETNSEKSEETEAKNSTNGIDRQPFRLTLSIEPLHTRAAIGSLVLAATMIWIGAVCFTSPKWQISLLIVVALLGILIGMLGVAHVLSWQKVNWLGLSATSSFATFVSRNSAGGFLNVCLSAALGLATWTFLKPRNPNDFYDVTNPNLAIEFFRRIEAGFAKLTTPQIASVLAVAFLLTAVACTVSRGATIGGIAACVVVLLLAGRRDRSAGRLFFALVVVSLGLAFILFFEFDERISKRFEELLNIESDSQSGRSYIWSVAMKAFSFFIATGSGLGTFHYAYLPFQSPTTGGWYYHAESLIAQTMVEFGWIGVCLVIFVLFQLIRALLSLAMLDTMVIPSENPLLIREVRNPQYLPAFVTGLALVVSQGVHSLVDFALVVPAVFIPAGLLAGMVCGIARAKKDSSTITPVTLNTTLMPRVTPTITNNPSSEEASGFIELSSSSRFAKSAETSGRSLSGSSASVSRDPHGRSSRRGSRSKGRSAGAENVHSISQQQATWESFIYRGTSPVSLFVASVLGSVSIAFMASSLSPIDAMERCDKMSDWVISHEKLPRNKRISSPSSYLVGLWGDTNMPIDQASSALRMIGEAVLYEFRCERFDDLEQKALGLRKVSWEETSPLLMNALLNGLIDVESTTTLKKTPLQIVGNEKQLARWDKAFELISLGREVCPLDWRLSWGEVLLDRSLTREQQLRHLEIAGILSKHRAENCFQIGVLANEAGSPEIASVQWRQTLLLSSSYAVRIASMISLKIPDKEIPMDLFPDDLNSLQAIAASPFSKDRFPITNERLWERIKTIANAIPVNVPGRWLSLADIAAHEEDTQAELECLEQASSRQPMNRALRMRWANRLAQADRIDEAIEQAEFCKTLESDDPQVLDAIRRWTEIREANR